jgi:hypothetical protein
MINLLPLEKINEIKKEFKFKKVVLVLNSTFFILLIFALFLFSFSQFLNYQIKKNEKEIYAKTNAFQETIEIQNKIKSFNSLLSKINNFQQSQFLISEFFEDLFTIFPNNLYLKTLNLQKGENKNNPFLAVQMTGVAQDREAVYSFRNILKTKENYREVNFLPNSWFKANFPVFSVTFEVTKK